MDALESTGIPKSLATVRGWTSGKVTAPVWALVAIADHTGRSVDELARELARRWHDHAWRDR
jgi:hypothetical protein